MAIGPSTAAVAGDGGGRNQAALAGDNGGGNEAQPSPIPAHPSAAAVSSVSATRRPGRAAAPAPGPYSLGSAAFSAGPSFAVLALLGLLLQCWVEHSAVSVAVLDLFLRASGFKRAGAAQRAELRRSTAASRPRTGGPHRQAACTARWVRASAGSVPGRFDKLRLIHR